MISAITSPTISVDDFDDSCDEFGENEAYKAADFDVC